MPTPQDEISALIDAIPDYIKPAALHTLRDMLQLMARANERKSAAPELLEAIKAAPREALIAELAGREGVKRVSVGNAYCGWALETRYERCGHREVVAATVLVIDPDYRLTK